MHLLVWNPLAEGEPVLRFAWLPYWLGANMRLRHKIMESLAQVIPPETTVKDVDEALWDRMDESVINTIVSEYPNIHGLRELLESLRKVEFRVRDDPAKG